MNLQDDPQSYFSRKRSLKDLSHSKDDDSGYIQGKVFMIWPLRNRLHRINLEVVEDSAVYRFEVEIPHKDGIAFRPHERVSLALKGMRVDQRKESSAPHYFPIVLRFPDGVVFKYLSGNNAGKVINTWEGNTDEWYNPPPQGDLVSCRDERVKGDDRPPQLSIPDADGAAAFRSTRPAESSTQRSGRSSKGRPRKKRRLHKEKGPTMHDKLANDTDKPRLDIAMSCHEQSEGSIHSSLSNMPDSCPKLLQVSAHANGEASIREDGDIHLSHEGDHSNVMANPAETSIPALRLKAGVYTQRGDIFTALGDLQKGHSMVNIIGVVGSVSPETKTRTNEWCRSFTLIDPSTIDSPRQSATVNCFQKKYVEWLPQVHKDDIVILRKLKVVEFNGVVAATGYSDKLRWAVYDPLGHTVRSPNKGSAPEKELIDDGMGYEFSPYWEPFQDSIELEYCRKIGEWWKAKQEHEGQNISTVQCSRARRQHLLISEASPNLPPSGFFDCTVEVLQKFNNHSSAATIYVTDYTVNALVRPVQATWCPPELSDRVLQLDMWDDARNIAKMMNPGEYWYLHNVRAKWNPNHYMEGTMQLAEKVAQLDETKLEVQPYLRALLTRKNEFQSNTSSLPSRSTLHVFPDMLLQDVEGSTSFLTCTVELLHNALHSRDGHSIYVTDYTYNPDLPTTVSTADWAHSLERRILKIKLDDAQARISSDIKAGSMFVIRNLRIRYTNGSGGIHGCLGGEDILILPLHDLSSHHAQTLQRNKEKWKRENMLDGLTTLSNGSHEPRELLRQSPALLADTTLQEVLAQPAPGTFRVLARAVDFFPFSLEDACVLQCTKCKSSPPPSFKRCPRCDDMMDTHCRWFYRLYILLQDEKGNELMVSLSGKECTLLLNVDPADFRSDQVAFRRFLAKLDPILGNLRDVHVAWSKNEHKIVESPVMTFTVESWVIEDGRGYGLLDSAPVQATGT